MTDRLSLTRRGAWAVMLTGVLTLTAMFAQPAWSQDAPAPTEPAAAAPAPAPAEDALTLEKVDEKVTAVTDGVNYVWTLVAAFLVFFMQAGFAMVEAGFTRAKSAVNIMMKNTMDFAVGTIAFWAIGFGLMFGVSASTGGWIGTNGFFFNGVSDDKWFFAFWMFQVVFAATAATIVSGAMAERTKFVAYLVYSAVISAVIYPIFGGWAWGNLYNTDNSTWLTAKGFVDFAGSTVVHSIGGWAALAGALVLGPRIGKYRDGKPVAIPGHNLPMAALGVFILWFGWFGFNAGSTTSGTNLDMARIAVMTNLSAAAGAISAMIISWAMFKKPDMSMTMNGALAGLVGITAGCANLSAVGSIVTGLVAGVLVFGAVLFFERRGIDDPVGAISVHGVCGAWGTLAVGLFADGAINENVKGLFFGGGATQLIAQMWGVGAAFIWSFGLCLILFKVIAATIGLRVTKEEELEGLDLSEHDNRAYPDFAMDPTSHGGYGLAGVTGGKPAGVPAGAVAATEA